MSKIVEALKLIASASPKAAGKAVATLASDQRPIAPKLFNEIAVIALNDFQAHFNEGERSLIVSCVTAEEELSRRRYMLRVRLTDEERVKLEAVREKAGFNSISEYVRFKIFENLKEDEERRT